MQKVYITDDYTATGIAGTAAIAVESPASMRRTRALREARGRSMTFAGKVNRLGIMVRGNPARPCRIRGAPLLVGYDVDDP